MTDLFFVHCPESGFDCFATLDAALDEANDRIPNYLDEGWSEDVTSVCVGKITHRATMCDQVFPDGEIDEKGYDERGDYWDPDCDYKCNYKMFPAGQNPAPESALVEALERCMSSMLDAGFNTRSAVIAQGWQALNAYRKQGGDK